jgi:putative peptide zinc metalloprotease protein
VRSRTEGFVEQLRAEPGSKVTKGEVLVTCSDPLLRARIRVLEAQLRELQAQYDIANSPCMINCAERKGKGQDRVQAEVTMDDIRQVQQQIIDARNREDELTVYSPADGVFFVPTAQDLPGRFVKRGETIGYVLHDAAVAARVVVPQSEVDLVRSRTVSVKIRLPERITVGLPATLVREVPAGTDQLPAKVLGQVGGGQVAIDPRDEKGVKAFQKVFLFDVRLPQQVHFFNVGGRVHVRFDHGVEPLAWRWYRSVRQLLLNRFSI